MGIRCAILFLVISLICIKSQEQEHCNYIYECCKKLDTECIEYCGPIIECTNNKLGQEKELEVTEAPAELINSTDFPEESSTFQIGQKQQVIVVGLCRKGFKVDGKGKCRRVVR